MAEKFLTPQQELFLAEYTNPKSANFGNALQSALKAGYSQEYSESITCQLPDWLSESLGDMKRLRKAEKTLDEILDLPNEKENLQAKTKVSTFVTERLGKHKYSIRTEVTGSNGEPLAKSPIFEDNQLKEKVNEIEKMIKEKLYAKKVTESNQDLESNKE